MVTRSKKIPHTVYKVIGCLVWVLALTPCAFAATYTWVGAADGNWHERANWTSTDGGTSYPNSVSDIAVFTGDASPRTPGSFKVGGLVLKAGKLTFNTYGYWLQVGGDATFDFADGTSVVFNGGGGITAAEHLATTLTIMGNCLITNEVHIGQTSAQFARIDLKAGSFIDVGRQVVATVFHLGNGAFFKSTNGGEYFAKTCFDLDEGAVADLSTHYHGDGVGAFTGKGTVKGFRGKLVFPNGAYTFSGNCESRADGTLSDWNLAPTDVEKDYLVIGSENTLSNCTVRLPDSEGRTLRFAAGIGAFKIGNFAASVSQSLYLADEAGEPIEVFARIEASTPSNMQTSGPGDLYVANRSNNAIEYKGTAFFEHTGVLGALAGIFGQDGQNTTFGDGANAANDAKLDGFEGIAGYNLGTSMHSVRNYFKNVNDFSMGALYGNGQFEFDGAGKATLEAFNVESIAGKKPYVVIYGGDVEAKSADAEGCIIQLAEGRTFTVNGGTIGSAEDTAQINAAGYVGWQQAGTLVLSNTTLHVGMDSKAKRFDLLQDGVLAHYGRLALPSNVTAEDPAIINLNGGTLRGVWPSGGYWHIQVPSGSADQMVITVGEKGGRIEAVNDRSTEYNYELSAQVTGDAAGDGGITKAGLASVVFTKPFNIAGPFRIKEGAVKVNVSSDAAALFGTGSLYLGNGIIDFIVGGKTYGIATGDGAALHYQDCGSIVVNNGTAANVTIGSEGNAAFKREAMGSVLTFASKSSSDALDGSGSKIKIAGTVNTTSAGIIDQPIFALVNANSSGRYMLDFMKVNDEGYLVTASDLYKSTFENDAVVSLNASTELGADAQIAGLRMNSAKLTIPEGKTLSFSEGDEPAAILFSHVSTAGTIGGAGTVDFGSREGVLVTALSSSDAYELSACVAAKIKGTGGLTLAGNMLAGQSSIRLSASNDYSGGTWVNGVEAGAEADGCFGSGTVYVGTGVGESGSLRLANVTLANELYVTGKGKLIGATYNSNDGVIFKPRAGMATLTGKVTLTDDGATIRVGDYRSKEASDAKIVFANTIAGGALKIVGAGTVELQKANTYGNTTTVSNATVIVGDVNALSSGEVILSDGATLVLTVEKDGAKLPNVVSGSGVIALKGTGYGKVSLDAIASDAELTLDMGTQRRATVNSLAGFTAVTSSRTSEATLYITDDPEGSFAGTIAENVKVEYGEPKLPGFSIIVK